jgi:hypothetical protein
LHEIIAYAPGELMQQRRLAPARGCGLFLQDSGEQTNPGVEVLALLGICGRVVFLCAFGLPQGVMGGRQAQDIDRQKTKIVVARVERLERVEADWRGAQLFGDQRGQWAQGAWFRRRCRRASSPMDERPREPGGVADEVGGVEFGID